MSRFYWPLILAGFFLNMAFAAQPPRCAPGLGDEQGAQMVERINRRYDDFFIRRQESDAADRVRRSGVNEVKKMRQQHEQDLAKAAKDYRREKVVRDSRLEQQWNDQQKEWQQQIEMARRCYVQQRAAAQAIEAKGRRIPGKLEYDLQDE